MSIPGSMKFLITVMVWFIILGTLEARAEKKVPETSAVSSSRSGGMIADTFQSPDWKKDFYYYAPEGDSVCPLVLFSGALNAGGPHEYEELIAHLVGGGNSVLYVPARRATLTRNKLVTYDLGMSGIVEAVHHWKQIDTTRIAVIGHGFGGGAAPALMRQLRLKKWGKRGALLYIMAPWYLYSIDKRQMRGFPKGVTLVVQSFEDDRLNDPHIAADIFTQLSVPPERKVYLRTESFKRNRKRFRADFTAPMGDRSVTDAWNLLDTYGIVRIIDRAMAYTFNKDTTAAYPSLGAMIDRATASDTSTLKVKRQFITRLERPLDSLPRGLWINQWNSPRNPRLDANIIRKGRKTYFRYRAKRMRQVTRYLTREVKARVGKDDTTDTDIINPIDSGFGADGPFKVAVKNFPNPVDASMSVFFFYPDSAPGRRPLILFLHGYNNGDTAYFSHLIYHVVSNGYALVFSPYPTFPMVDSEKPVMEKYETLLAGFEEAVKRFSQKVDTSRIGIFGQSFGAGGVPWVTKKVMNERSWGREAAFLFISAPWYTFGMTQQDFEAIPKQVKLLLTTYDDDVFNDHQVAVDIFRSVRIPADEKCFITFMSDTLDSVILPANHFVPYSAQSVNGVIDNFDFFGIFKLFDALAAYTFTGDKEGKIVALGKGNEEQCYMGVWPDGSPVTPAVVSTDPHPRHETLKYVFSWENKLNPRREPLVSPSKKRIERRRKQRAAE